jgi:hypothetical protein
MMLRSALVLLSSVAAGIVPFASLARAAQTIAAEPAQDNTLIENSSGALSSGAGPLLFSGRIASSRDSIRRSVLEFDLLATIPRGSTVHGAALVLQLARAGGDEKNLLTLHRLLSPWGEGASVSGGGRGAPAEQGDATWLHRFFPDSFWGTPGGDYAPEPSAAALVGTGAGRYIWGPSAALKEDVQAWIDDPGSNHGWILLGDESERATVKAFFSREMPDEALRPVLVVHFSLPAGRREARTPPGRDQRDSDRLTDDQVLAELLGTLPWRESEDATRRKRRARVH